jgi:hypothetical protein
MKIRNLFNSPNIWRKSALYFSLLGLVLSTACEVEEPVPTYTLTTSITPSEGGKISISPKESNYVEGSQVTLTPEPNENWVFKQWEGDATGNITPLQLTMTANKNVVGVFVKRDYPLNIKIEGEGIVEEKIVQNPSGREYPHGTTVELTPKPKEGWEFDSWSGDLTGNESPKRITVDKQKNVTVKFKEKAIFYTKKTLLLTSTKFSPATVESTLRIVSAAFIYKDSNGAIFAFHPGNPMLNGGNSIETVPPASSQIMRKVNGEWERFKEDDKAQFWGARNYKLVGDKVVIGDANEYGTPQSGGWRGNILYGKILPGGNIDWTTVNKPEEMGYFHDATMGDLNNDGLMDIGGTPGSLLNSNETRSNIFIQQAGGQFKQQNELLTKSNSTLLDGNPNIPSVPLAIQFENLFGDARPEIITAEYGGGFLPNRGFEHQIRIFAYDALTNSYELKFRAYQPSAFTWWIGATSIKVLDANKDGIKDLAVAREDPAGDAGAGGNGFDVWLGKSDGTFTFAFSKQFDLKEMQFREFVILDANNDGKDDIILIPFHYGSLFRFNGPCGPGSCQGIKLNHLIWLSKGDGTFEHYSKSALVFPEINVNFLLPYKEGNKLYFYGTNYSGSVPWPTFNYQHDVFDIRVTID